MLFTEDGICGRGFMIYTWGNYICAIEFHGSIAITFLLWWCSRKNMLIFLRLHVNLLKAWQNLVCQ